jgi:uncharacterized protein YbjT (DUF2867 family)
MKTGWRRFDMNVLITGATGFIGKRLLRACIEQGDEVSVITRTPEKLGEEISKV